MKRTAFTLLSATTALTLLTGAAAENYTNTKFHKS